MANKQIRHPASLIRFISYLETDPDNVIVNNVIDQEPNFISRFYTPNLRISPLASKVLKELQDNSFLTTNRDVSPNSLIGQLSNSNLKAENPHLYQIAQTIVLESFSLIYAIEDKEELIKFISADDINLVRTNLKYLLDAIGTNHKYTDMIENIQQMDVTLGYIEAQVPVIKNRGVSNG